MEYEGVPRIKGGWRGYVSSRAVAGSMLPQRVQNLVIRTYAERHGLSFLLSAVEYCLPDSTMMLDGVLEDLEGLDGLIFYSMHQLPEDPERRRSTYDRVLGAGKGLRFALEELAVLAPADVAAVEDIIAVRALSERLRGADLGSLGLSRSPEAN